MRFISDDNKVFNTLEECKEHEESLKKQLDDKLEEERKKTITSLRESYEGICDQISDWLSEYDKYLDNYKKPGRVTFDKKSDDNIDLSEFIEFLEKTFEEICEDKKNGKKYF